MKRFLLNIAVVIAIVLLANCIYLVVIGGNLRNYAAKYLDIEPSARILVVGDSHASRAWSANDDKSIFNFAFGSDNIHDMRLKLNYASKNMDGLDTIILSFEPHLISIYREIKNNGRTSKLLTRSPIAVKAVTLLPLVFDPNTEFDSKMFAHRLIRGGSKQRIETSPVVSFSVNKTSAQKRFKEQFGSGEISQSVLNDFQLLINECRTLDLHIVALRYPVQSYYDSLIASSPESLKMLQAMDSLAESNGLEIIKVSSGFRDGRLFSDHDHLNKEGSERFINEILGTMRK